MRVLGITSILVFVTMLGCKQGTPVVDNADEAAPLADPMGSGDMGDSDRSPIEIDDASMSEEATMESAPLIDIADLLDAPVDPENPAILKRPFSSDQIRDAWPVGFTMVIKNWGEGLPSSTQRWEVIEADEIKTTVEITFLDETGAKTGQSTRETFAWEQLRDMNTFPSDRSTVETETRDLPFGSQECLKYVIWDQAGGTVTEIYFGQELPGLPVFMEVRLNGDLVATSQQQSRSNTP